MQKQWSRAEGSTPTPNRKRRVKKTSNPSASNILDEKNG